MQDIIKDKEKKKKYDCSIDDVDIMTRTINKSRKIESR